MWHPSQIAQNNDKRDGVDFPIVNLPYLSSYIPESPAYGVLFHSYVMLGIVRNMKIICSGDLLLFQSLLKEGYLHINIKLLLGNSYAHNVHIPINTLCTYTHTYTCTNKNANTHEHMHAYTCMNNKHA